jgi:uncharacterized protein YndB with AHSA1/START domain
MKDAGMSPTVHDTFVIERRYPVSPERAFRAFSDPAQKRRWFTEGKTQDTEVFEMDFRVGGADRQRYRMTVATPFPGVAIANEGAYQDIVPNERIVLASTMTLGDRRISSSLVTFEFLPAGQGVDIRCTHQAAFYDGADGPAMRKDGWEKLLDACGRTLEVA